MNARFSVVAMPLLIMGLFMLVGFAPLGVAMLVLAAIIQSSHRARKLEHQKALRCKGQGRRDAELVARVARFRS